jgi:DNA-binding NarL/FixJ family response regulator
MDDNQFGEITGKMDLVIRLLALNLVKDFPIQKDKIAMLSSFGFGPSEIAKLLGTTPNTVSVALSEIKKKTEKGQQKMKVNQNEPKQNADTAMSK